MCVLEADLSPLIPPLSLLILQYVKYMYVYRGHHTVFRYDKLHQATHCLCLDGISKCYRGALLIASILIIIEGNSLLLKETQLFDLKLPPNHPQNKLDEN